jgi:hypothetical protein
MVRLKKLNNLKINWLENISMKTDNDNEKKIIFFMNGKLPLSSLLNKLLTKI